MEGKYRWEFHPLSVLSRLLQILHQER
ncbi:unnamed protein product [Victoria cruziana]